MKKNIVKNIVSVIMVLISVFLLFAGLKIIYDSPQHANQKYQLILDQQLAKEEEFKNEKEVSQAAGMTNYVTMMDYDVVIQIYSTIYIVIGALLFLLGAAVFSVTYGTFLSKKDLRLIQREVE